MEPNHDRSIILRPEAQLERVISATNRVIAKMISESLLLVKSVAPAEIWESAIVQYNRGVAYYYGHGVPQDYVEAAKWFRIAAERGNPGAQTGLGRCYNHGQGVLKDYGEGVKWYGLAARNGNALGQCALGVCYENGWGVSQDHVEAARWYCRAAVQGDALGEFCLGFCYESGQGLL